MKRIYTPSARVLDKTAAHWTGDTAVRVMAKRIKQYAQEKKDKLVARRKSARRRGA